MKEGLKEGEGKFTPEVTPEVKRLIAVIEGEMTRKELQGKLGLKDSSGLVCPSLTTKCFPGLVFFPAITLNDGGNHSNDGSLFF